MTTMKFIYKPKSDLEKFGVKVYRLLVENFDQTFFVGGMVRDLMLKRKAVDVDIATSAIPDEVAKVLSSAKISFDDKNKRFGSLIAKQGGLEIEITTLREDLQSKNRYPKVSFINNPKIDSQRRDFTMNGLYLSLKDNQILDFHKSAGDIRRGQIKFIGAPGIKIKQDPLRIIRALRFALVLNFNLEKITKSAIKKSFTLIESLTKSKIQKEIGKMKNKNKKIILKKVINNPKLLDKYFK